MVVDDFNVFYGVAGLKAFDSVMVLMISLFPGFSRFRLVSLHLKLL